MHEDPLQEFFKCTIITYKEFVSLRMYFVTNIQWVCIQFNGIIFIIVVVLWPSLDGDPITMFCADVPFKFLRPHIAKKINITLIFQVWVNVLYSSNTKTFLPWWSFAKEKKWYILLFLIFIWSYILLFYIT